MLAKQAHTLNTSPAAPLTCSATPSKVSATLGGALTMANTLLWLGHSLKVPFFNALGDVGEPSWYYVAWGFTVMLISSTAITRAICCYQQGNLWIPADTAGRKWMFPGTDIFCASLSAGRPTYVCFLCIWFLREQSLSADPVVKLFRYHFFRYHFSGTKASVLPAGITGKRTNSRCQRAKTQNT